MTRVGLAGLKTPGTGVGVASVPLDCTGVDPEAERVATGENARSADTCSVATAADAVSVGTVGTAPHAMNATLAAINAIDRSTKSDTPEC